MMESEPKRKEMVAMSYPYASPMIPEKTIDAAVCSKKVLKKAAQVLHRKSESSKCKAILQCAMCRAIFTFASISIPCASINQQENTFRDGSGKDMGCSVKSEV
ncbi:hypothetical protein Dimus_037108, partial [Dionaea muscipula]